MSNMSYCRHENTARDLAEVWDLWEDWEESKSNEYEAKARARIVRMVFEMHEQFVFDGTYEEMGVEA